MKERNRLISDYNVIVVGAGPAGLSFAGELKESGLSVLIMENSSEDKWYTGKSIYTVDVEGMGIEGAVVNTLMTYTHYSQFGEFVYYDATDHPNLHGKLINSRKAAEILLEKTGAAIKYNVRVDNVIHGNRPILMTNQGNYQADIIIDATGSRSAISRMLPEGYALDDNPIVAALYGREVTGEFDRSFELTPAVDCANGSWITPVTGKIAHLLSVHYSNLFNNDRGLSVEETQNLLKEFGLDGLLEFIKSPLSKRVKQKIKQKYGVDISLPRINELGKEMFGFIRCSPIEDYSFFKGTGVIPIGSAAGIVQPLFWDAYRRSHLSGKQVGEAVVSYFIANGSLAGIDETHLLNLQYKEYRNCVNLEIALRDWRIKGGGKIRLPGGNYINGSTMLNAVTDVLAKNEDPIIARELMLKNGVPPLVLAQAIVDAPYITPVVASALLEVVKVSLLRKLGIYRQPQLRPPIPFSQVISQYPHVMQE